MIVRRSERFEADLERLFRWYLLETGLDAPDALALARRFAEAVDSALTLLSRNPEVGPRRFRAYPELAGTRSWRLGKPFARFIVFYRVEGDVVSAERLLEGSSRLVAGREIEDE